MRALRDRAHGDRPPPRRAARRPRRVGLASRSLALVRWARADARRRRPLRHRARPRLQRRHASPPRCCGSPARRCSTTSGPPSSTTSTAASRARWWCPTRSRPERLARYGAHGQAARLRGPQGGVLPGRLRARRGGARASSALDRAPPDRGRAHAAGGVALPPLRERPVRRACSSACARPPPSDGLQAVVLPRVDVPARGSCAAMPGFIVPEHAIDAQSLIAFADLVISAGGTMNREAVALGTPVYTTFAGPPRGGRRAPDRRGPAAHARRAPERARRCGRERGEPRRPRVRRDPRVLVELLLSPLWPAPAAAPRVHAVEVASGPYNPCNAPTDPLGGPSAPPPLAAAAGSGRGAGRARVLPRLPAALQQRPAALLRAPARSTIWWVLARQPAGAGALRASTSAAGATPASATTRRSCGR